MDAPGAAPASDPEDQEAPEANPHTKAEPSDGRSERSGGVATAIQLATNIEGYGVVQVELLAPYRRLFVEIASDKDVDVAVVTEEQLRAFNESETRDDVGIDWIGPVRQYDFECRLLPRGKQYLLIWNSYQDEPATVAYKITGVDEYAPPYPGDVRTPGQSAPQPAAPAGRGKADRRRASWRPTSRPSVG